jgi:hypothetical protein
VENDSAKTLTTLKSALYHIKNSERSQDENEL